MKATSAVVAVAAAAATTGASVLPRATSGIFQLTHFYFGGSPMSIEQTYSFDVTDGQLADYCHTSSDVQPGIATFPLTPCQKQYAFSFTYDNRTNPEPGYILEVTVHKASSAQNHTGCRFFPQSDVILVQDPNNPNGNYYELDAPENFNLTWTTSPCIFN